MQATFYFYKAVSKRRGKARGEWGTTVSQVKEEVATFIIIRRLVVKPRG